MAIAVIFLIFGLADATKSIRQARLPWVYAPCRSTPRGTLMHDDAPARLRSIKTAMLNSFDCDTISVYDSLSSRPTAEKIHMQGQYGRLTIVVLWSTLPDGIIAYDLAATVLAPCRLFYKECPSVSGIEQTFWAATMLRNILSMMGMVRARSRPLGFSATQ